MSETPKPIASPPTEEELTGRLEKVRALMRERNLDYYVSFDPVNIYYLTNFANYVHERPFLLVISNSGAPNMVCPLLEAAHVKTRARIELDYVTYYEFPAPKGENWFEVYQLLIENDALVGIEGAMPIHISKKTPGEQIVDDIIDEVRLVKTEYEIGRNVHACGIISEGHKVLLEVARPGALEMFVFTEVQRFLMEKILEDIPDCNYFVTKPVAMVLPPSKSHDPHFVPTPFLPMEEGGPHVSGVGGQIDGYGVEIERTFFLGHVPENAKRPFEVSMEARALAYDMAKPGAVLSEIDKRVRKVIADAGYGHNIIHRTGHGMGITGHEAPYVALGDERELVPGMMISIEPGIYIEGVGGFRHSDTVLITDTGNAKLTEAPETLDELTIPL